VNEEASRLTHDLAIDATGFGRPSPVAAGLVFPTATGERRDFPWAAAAAATAAVAVISAMAGRSAGRRRGWRAPHDGRDGRAA
jgi:hypothetical protein